MDRVRDQPCAKATLHMGVGWGRPCATAQALSEMIPTLPAAGDDSTPSLMFLFSGASHSHIIHRMGIASVRTSKGKIPNGLGKAGQQTTD